MSGNITRIYLLRHGESLGNAQKIILGHTDLDLSPVGYAQARATAEHLADLNIDAVYSSDLKRAYNTAMPHAVKRRLKIHTSEGLRELFCGDWENKSTAEISEKYGEIYSVDWVKHFPTFIMPGGESVWGAGERFLESVREISRKNLGKTIIIASHGGVIRAFWAKITDTPIVEIVEKIPFPSNASYSIVEYSDELGFVPIEYSHDDHLSGVGITKIEP